MSRFIVCGGRDYADWIAVFAWLDRLHAKVGITAIIHGAAPGADSLASEWASLRGVSEEAFPADWSRHGKAAGPLRNQRMLEEGRPTGLIAFPGGAGTADMKERAIKAGLTVWEPEK